MTAPASAPALGRRLPRDVGRLLGALARDHGWLDAGPLLTPGAADPDLLLRAALHHRLGGPLHLAVQDRTHRGPSEAALDRIAHELAVGHGSAIAGHMRAVATLHEVHRLLAGAGIPSAVLKGPALAGLCYPRPDLRWYRDLDLLVAPTDLEGAVEVLEAAGSTLLDRNWDLIDAVRPGELHLLTPHGVVLDLHFQLVNNAERRSRFRVDPTEILGRAETVTLGGHRVGTADATDSVLHLALHTALSGGDRLGWFSDVDQAVRNRPPLWPDLVARAHRWGVASLVHQVLVRAIGSVGTPVPTDVLRALSPGTAWDLVVRSVHHADDLSRTTGRRSPARALARQARPGAGRTLWGVLRGAAARAPEFAGDDAGNPRSVLHDAGGAAGRRRFFDSLR